MTQPLPVGEAAVRELCASAARLLADALSISPHDQDVKALLLAAQIRAGILIPAEPPSWRAKFLPDETSR